MNNKHTLDIMTRVEDLSLSREEKLKLITAIPKRQAERWQRMKFFHGCEHIAMRTRHFFMQNEINLMREQQVRLERLKQFL